MLQYNYYTHAVLLAPPAFLLRLTEFCRHCDLSEDPSTRSEALPALLAALRALLPAMAWSVARTAPRLADKMKEEEEAEEEEEEEEEEVRTLQLMVVATLCEESLFFFL